MRDAGILTLYSLENVKEPGLMPTEKLVKVCKAYYDERTVGVTRAYAALGAKQQIDKLVIAYNTEIPVNASYAILEDGNQYRISLKQMQGDDTLLTLERLEDLYDVYTEQTE